MLGNVYDPSGAPVAHATITVADTRHSTVRTATTNTEGAYVISGLNPAVYEVSASAVNFTEISETGVALTVDTQKRIDFQLVIAGQKRTIEVIETAQPIQRDSGELGTVLTQARIDALPLNRRDFLQLALLTPGVMSPVEGSELSTRGAFSMHVNGGREEYNNFLLDGADNNDPYVNRYDVEPPVDSIQEFKVATSSYSAEYGRSAAGQVNVITRQGSNEFHGSLYEYLRNSVLDARNFFDGSNKPTLIRNQFGFAVGGPVIHGKTYFFAATDFLRGKQGLSRYASVPTMPERGGDLRDLCQTGFSSNGLCNPAAAGSNLSATQISDPLTGQPYKYNQIPSSSISTLVHNIVNMYPQPNVTSGPGNYLGHPVQTDNNSQGSFRIDHQLSAVDQLNFRYSYGVVDSFEPFPEGSNNLNGYGDYVRDHLQNGTAQYRRILSSHIINNVLLGFNRFSRDLLPQNFKVDVGKLWGVNWLNVPPAQFGYPGLNVNGDSSAGDNFALPILRHTNTYQAGDNISWEHGAHLLHLGGEFRELQLNGQLDLLTRGSLNFTGALSGSGISDLLLGYPTFTIQAVANNPLTLRSQAYNFYAQDDWRILPRLTLNLGVRYEYEVPAYDPTNRMSTLDLKTGQIVTLGKNGYSRSGIQSDFNNFAPRIGLAWSPASSLVVRAGYGIFYDSGMFIVNSSQYFNPPEFNLFVYLPLAGLITVNDPFPSNGGITPPPSLSVLDPNLRTPYMQQWNLTVEKALRSVGTMSLSYVGSKGTKLIRAYDLNQPAPAAGDLQSRRQYQNYGNIFFVQSGANSSFNSLQATFNRPVGAYLNLWSAYTYSHSLDDASAFQGTVADPNFPQNSHNLNAEWASSSFDIRHRLVMAAVVELPRGNRWTRNTQFQQILTVQSGQPFTPILTTDNSNTGNNGGSAGSDRPNIIGDPHSGSCPNPNGGSAIPVGTPDCWFNTGAFAVPTPNTFGNAGRNILRGPGFASYDLSLQRSFNLWEGKKLNFQAQAFNLFNRANFDLPNPLVSFAPGSAFGKIVSAKSARQLQMALRFSF
jgi:outer membrane receptor protein involved in Fe transport